MQEKWGCWFVGADWVPVSLGSCGFGHLPARVLVGLSTCRPYSLVVI